jgi:hypothetical protein
MIAISWGRLVCLPLPEWIEPAAQFEVSDYMLPRPGAVGVAGGDQVYVYLMILGAGQLMIGLLLMKPSTHLAGTVLASAFLGGAICLCVARTQPCLFPSGMLVLAWAGASLRKSAVPGGFGGCETTPATTLNGSGVANPRRALGR